jgi:hypothetical protein
MSELKNPPPPGKTYVCEKCERSFANELDLSNHECAGKPVSKNTQVSDGIG